MKKILFLIIPAILGIVIWLIDKYLFVGELFPDDVVKYMAQLSGIMGLTYITLNFVLASRLDSLERFFGGYDKVYRYHMWSGRVAYGFIFTHPVFLTLKSLMIQLDLNSLVRYFIPVLNNPLEYNIGVLAFWLLTLLITLTVVIKLPYHIWKQTHRTMILVLLLATLHGYMNTYNTSYIVWPWILFLGIIGITSWIYREVYYEHFSNKIYKYKVAEIHPKGDITEIVMESTEDRKLSYDPGQFALFSFRNHKVIPIEFHPFSLSSSPTDDFIRVSAKGLGDYTDKLRRAQSGDLVKVLGPHGGFTNIEDTGKQLWIAGGIGVTPFLSMLRYYKSKGLSTDIVFFYGCKNESESVYLQEIQELITGSVNMKLIVHYSDKEGFVNAEYFKKNIEDLNERTVYLCGPAVMMKALRKGFKQIDYPKKKLKFEDFSFK